LVSGDRYLLPEFCLAVGMTERLNEQKKIFREVAMKKNGDAPIKIKESIRLVKQIMSDPLCIELMKDWRFFVEGECVSHQGYKLDAGNILMGHQTEQTAEKSINSKLDQIGERIKFSIDETGGDLKINLNRNKMFE